MSIYQFSPSPSFNLETSYATWNGGFSDNDIQEIIEVGEHNRMFTATVGSKGENENDEEKRRCSYAGQMMFGDS